MVPLFDYGRPSSLESFDLSRATGPNKEHPTTLVESFDRLNLVRNLKLS